MPDDSIPGSSTDPTRRVIQSATSRNPPERVGARANSEASRRLRLARADRQRTGLGTFLGALILLAMLGWSATLWNRGETAWNIKRWQNLGFQGQNWSDSRHLVLTPSGELWRASANATGVTARRLWNAPFPSRVAPLESAHGIVIGALDGTVSLLDESGKEFWNHRLPAAISTRPAAWNGGIVAACDSGLVVAWNRAGAEIWRTQVAGTPGAALVLAQGRVVVAMLGGNGARGGLVALDLASGQKLWRFPADTRDRAAGVAAPFFDAHNGRVFWCNDEGAIVCLNAQNGAKIWKTFARPLPDAAKNQAVVMRGAPVVAGQTLVAGANDGALRAFDARDGRALWTANLGAPIYEAARPLVRANAIFWLVDGAQTALIDAKGQILRQGGAGYLQLENGLLMRWENERWQWLGE